MGPLMTLVLAGVRPEHAGAASGVLAAAQQVGNAVGIARDRRGLLRRARHGGLGAAAVPPAFRDGLLALAALGVVVVALVQRLPRAAPRRPRGS